MTSTHGVVPRTKPAPSNREEGRAVMLTGTFDRNLDAKGRLSLPAAIRSEFGEHVYVLPAPDVDALYVFSEEEFEKWVMGLFEKQGGFNSRSSKDQQLMRKVSSRATKMDIDGASRIGLSDKLREKGGLDREVTVVGNWNHLEIWDRAKWEAVDVDDEDDDSFFLDD